LRCTFTKISIYNICNIKTSINCLVWVREIILKQFENKITESKNEISVVS